MGYNIELLDSTLREGLQSNKVFMTLEQQKKVSKELDEIGIQYIEIDLLSGFFNEDDAIYDLLQLKKSKLVGFISTRKKHTKIIENNELVKAAHGAVDYISIFGKSSSYQVEQVLETSKVENLRMISESVGYLKQFGKHVFFDAEHFFDGYKEDAEYAIETLKVASAAGAELIVLCDTNGGTMPWEINCIIQEVKKVVSVELGIHCHNDCGLALANALIAYLAGINHIQGTFLGNGERCGNTPLNCLIPILQLKLHVKCTSSKVLKRLVEKTSNIANLLSYKLDANTPFVGSNSFLHKAGTHINGVIKCGSAYEHIEPEVVGNERKFAVSNVSGKSLIKSELVQLNLLNEEEVEQIDTKTLQSIIGEFKIRVREGYHYEEAQDSFKVFLCKRLGLYRKTVEIIEIKMKSQKKGDFMTIKIKVRDCIKEIDEVTENIMIGLLQGVKEVLVQECPEINRFNFVSCRMKNRESKEGKVAVYLRMEYNGKMYNTVSVNKSYMEACKINVEEAIWCFLQDVNHKYIGCLE